MQIRIAVAFLACLLAACSAVERITGGDKVDYRSSAVKTPGLDVPPDLTQLSRDSRYQAQGGTVSASTFQSSPTAPIAGAGVSPPVVAPVSAGEMRIERAGNQRWLSTPVTPEQLWPQLKAFWEERGFKLAVDEPLAGVMETDWAENRAKIPDGAIRSVLGRVFDSFYSTSERDRFRTRVERTDSGSEIYISHRGMEEVYITEFKDQLRWQPRPVDAQLEAEFLSRLMQKLAAKEASATTAAVSPAVAEVAARARVLGDTPGAAMQIDEGFDRAWRRVGLALDRSGFTVEDRDRRGGLYFVRYVDPSQAGKEEPGFFKKLFGAATPQLGPERYRIAVKPDGEQTTVAVLDAQGAPEAGPVGKRIVALLVEDLK